MLYFAKNLHPSPWIRKAPSYPHTPKVLPLICSHKKNVHQVKEPQTMHKIYKRHGIFLQNTAFLQRCQPPLPRTGGREPFILSPHKERKKILPNINFMN